MEGEIRKEIHPVYKNSEKSEKRSIRFSRHLAVTDYSNVGNHT
ncbi:hypothetical protein CCACVL1_13470 [Corchorus capsularis]|uniref:Uncharacterized protein n=1 Tax=Corchorus capsularis TaxID=210143 RepID=A0A1R3IAY9_COCAP|nr:hypothetical protein CCACVL1_13470 [Corchorus capsularis]